MAPIQRRGLLGGPVAAGPASLLVQAPENLTSRRLADTLSHREQEKVDNPRVGRKFIANLKANGYEAITKSMADDQRRIKDYLANAAPTTMDRLYRQMAQWKAFCQLLKYPVDSNLYHFSRFQALSINFLTTLFLNTKSYKKNNEGRIKARTLQQFLTTLTTIILRFCHDDNGTSVGLWLLTEQGLLVQMDKRVTGRGSSLFCSALSLILFCSDQGVPA
jgi:hypothetical protein